MTDDELDFNEKEELKSLVNGKSNYLYDLLDDPTTREYNEFRQNILKRDKVKKDKKNQ
jgi:hypothetical protein